MEWQHSLAMALLLACLGAEAPNSPDAAVVAAARPLLAAADKQITGLSDPTRNEDSAYAWADAHLRLNDWDHAQKLIEQLPAEQRDWFYVRASESASQLGQLAITEEILKQITDPKSRTEAISLAATYEAKCNHLEAAQKHLAELEDAELRFAPMLAIAGARAKAGDHVGAREMCMKALDIAREKHGLARQHAIERSAEMLAEIGEVPAAAALTNEMPSDPTKASLIVYISWGQGRAGDVAGMRGTLAEVSEARKASGFIVIVQKLASEGDIKGAQELVPLCNGLPPSVDFARTWIGVAQARAGQIPDALGGVAGVSVPGCQAQLYSAIAIAYARSGNAADAQKTLILARQAMASENEVNRVGTRKYLFEALAFTDAPASTLTEINQSEISEAKISRMCAEVADMALHER
jgi:hypothetical protein